MAQADKNATTGASGLATIALLVQASDGDTLYRDLYLNRAAELLSSVCPEERYRGALASEEQVDLLLRQAKVAVGRQDWEQVRDLSGRAADLRRGLDAQRESLAAAATVYAAQPVALDPLSPGLAALARKDGDPVRSRTETTAALRKLEQSDAPWRDLYAQRGQALAALALSPPPAKGSASASSGSSFGDQALQAAERGDPEALRRLAESMLGQSSAGAGDKGPVVGTRRLMVPDALAEAFPPASVEHAGALGLEYVEARYTSAAAAGAIRNFVQKYAWAASPAVHEMARDGVIELWGAVRAQLEQAEMSEIKTDQAQTLVENLALFALHQYVNSAGLRYVPLPVEREPVLVESHPDGEEPVTALLRELGLDRRRALARSEIENALFRHGGRILREHLKLDPRAFRLVCLPADIFMRLGRDRGWGQRPEWTHIDGYQVLRNGGLRALVGGHAGFGGIADLCAIGATDARENVVARFAVVRRDRLGVRLG